MAINLRYVLLFCGLLMATSFFPITAQSQSKERIIISHDLWADLLEQYVDEQGNVDYANFSKNVESLNDYLEYLGSFKPREDWPREEVLAFYINLYNAATVRLILEHYPVSSIRDIKQPWAKKRIKLSEKELSLNEIEHRVLRKMNEPRIHFAINCASASCPKLINVPFKAQSMEEQLDQVSREFINDPSRNEITTNHVAISALFKWYRIDFTKEGSLLDYIGRYTDEPILSGTKVRYLKYDWSLNEQQ